jgi:hypothetical protein
LGDGAESGQPSDAGRMAEARSVLSAVDVALVNGDNRMSRAAHHLRFAATVGGLFLDD